MSVMSGFVAYSIVKVLVLKEQKPGKSHLIQILRKKPILKLYEKAPPKSAVICYDEWGPLELKPIHGYHWSKRGKPKRLRATYRRTSDTEQMLSFYDVNKDCLVGTIHKWKQIRDVLTAFKMLRRSYPKSIRLYVIMDNLPLHKSKILMKYYKQNNTVLNWTPTYASWINIIEGHFSPLKKFSLTVSDDFYHLSRRKRIYKYLRWRNRKVKSHKLKLAKVFNH